MNDPRRLTPAEFEVLQVLWSRSEPLAVADVLEVVRGDRPVAYTTVMTVLDKLARKGTVTREKQGKAYFYSPAVDRAEVLGYLIGEFTGNYFEGSNRKLLSFLSGDQARPESTRRRSRQAPSVRATPPPRANTSDLDVVLL